MINATKPGDSLFLFSMLRDTRDLDTAVLQVKVLQTFAYFHVSQVNGKFINHKTRQQVLDTMAITKIVPKNNFK